MIDFKFEHPKAYGPECVLLHIAGFHDRGTCDGEIFLNGNQAADYVSDKVIHVEGFIFRNAERAKDFILQQCTCWVNYHRSFDYDPKNSLDEIKDLQIREFTKELLDGGY